MATKVAVVTGASAGIGLHTALGLARAGMRVVMVGRNRKRTEAACRLVTERAPGAEIETVLADFASLEAVRVLAETSSPATNGSTCWSTMRG